MIVYIHGARASSESFSYIQEHINSQVGIPDICFDYESSEGFRKNLYEMQQKLADADWLFFVGHSLGGIYALHLADQYRNKTVGGVTLSTPYGGCIQADFAKYFLPFSQLLKDIGTMSTPIRHVKKIDAPANWTNIVTTEGHSPWINYPNDGVVTVKSMRAREDFELIDLPINHYEVVLSKRVVDLILDRINNSGISKAI